MRLCMEQGIEPANMAIGAAAGIKYFKGKNIKPEDIEPLVNEFFQSEVSEYKSEIIKLLKKVMSP